MLSKRNDLNNLNTNKFNNSSIKNTFLIIFGAFLGQVATLLLTPILTRIYLPEDFGNWGLFISFISIFGGVVNLKYDLAIMLPKSDDDAFNILLIATSISLLVSLVFGLSIYVTKDFISKLLNWNNFSSIIFYIFSSILFRGIINSFNLWNMRKKNFGIYSLYLFLYSFFTFTVPALFGILGFRQGSNLVIGSFIGIFLSLFFILLHFFRNYSRLFESLNIKRFRTNLLRFINFPKYSALSVLFNEASWQIPSFAISIYFSKAELGFFTLSLGILKLPLSQFGSAVGHVTFQKTSEAKHNTNIDVIVEEVFSLLVKIITPIIFFVLVLSPDIFKNILGEIYIESGIYLQILAIWIFVWFISIPLSHIYFVMEKQKTDLMINIVIFITRLVSFIIGAVLNNIYIALGLFSLTGILVYGFLVLKSMNLAGINNKKIIDILFNSILKSIPLLLMLFLFPKLKIMECRN